MLVAWNLAAGDGGCKLVSFRDPQCLGMRLGISSHNIMAIPNPCMGTSM